MRRALAEVRDPILHPPLRPQLRLILPQRQPEKSFVDAMQRGRVLRPPDSHQIVETHDFAFLRAHAGQRRFDPVDLHSHIALGDADDRGDFPVAEAVEHQQGDGAIDVLELRDLAIQPLHTRVGCIRRRRRQQAFHNRERLLAPLMPVLLARPRDRRVQGDAVHPCRHGRFAAERIHRAPDLNDDFLKEILTVSVLERIRVDHFEQDPFVARQPLVEDAIPFAVEHSPAFHYPMEGWAGAPAGNPMSCNPFWLLRNR